MNTPHPPITRIVYSLETPEYYSLAALVDWLDYHAEIFKYLHARPRTAHTVVQLSKVLTNLCDPSYAMGAA